jgi:hypothetical protein
MFSKAIITAIALTLVVTAVPATAQLIEDTGSNVQASWNTAKSGTMALPLSRPAGEAGARRTLRNLHSDTIIRSRFGPVITEEKPELTPEQEVRIEVLTTLFTNLNLALGGVQRIPPRQRGPAADPGDDTTSGLVDLLGSISGTGSDRRAERPSSRINFTANISPAVPAFDLFSESCSHGAAGE